MNLLIVSPGRRVEIVKAFKEQLNLIDRKVFTLDMSSVAPGLYESDQYFVVKKDFNHLEEYIKEIINICVEHNITFLLTLIDPELKLFKDHEHLFRKANIFLIISEKEFIDNTLDKFLFYTKYKKLLPLIDTFISIQALKQFYGDNIPFPVVAKERHGSASLGLEFIKNDEELDKFIDIDKKFIFQPCINKTEYGVDVYFDFYTHNIIDIFIKEKVSMKSGETDKSISIWNENIYDVIKNLNSIKGILGPIDIDIFIDNTTGDILINEINPRFGGGYYHAHYSSCDFVSYVITNMQNIKNTTQIIPHYKNNILMLKYNAYKFKDFKDLNLVNKNFK